MENKKDEDLRQTKMKLYKSNVPVKKDKSKNDIFYIDKRVKNELDTIPNESRRAFRQALNKHSFDAEVFIPSSFRITNNEFKNKNYLLNNLVSFEKKMRKQKELVEPIKKETNRFSKQYNLIKEDNHGRQKDYVKNIEKFYESKGYSRSGIQFKNNDNIFSPSAILDRNFGKNMEEDVYKYSNKEYKKDYQKDQNLIKKWRKGVKETKDNKSRAKNKELEEETNIKRATLLDKEINDKKMKEELLKIEKESLIQREKEQEKEEKLKQLELIKKSLMEEERIKNMSKEEYFLYNKGLKDEIKKTMESLEELNKDNSDYFNPSKLRAKNLKNTISSKTYNIMNPKEPKNYKEKIVFSSIELSKKNNNFNLSKKRTNTENNNKMNQNYLTNKFNNYNNNSKKDAKTLLTKEKSPLCVTENNIFLSSNNNKSNKDRRDSLPKIGFIFGDNDKDSKTIDEKDKEIINEKLKKKLIQTNELDNLYKLIYNNKKYFFEQFPYQKVENYFNKYTTKRLPSISFEKGSNIHGLVEELQQIVEKNDFYKVAEASNVVKREIEYKRGFNSYNNVFDEKKLDADKIQELDEKIPVLHYHFAEEILTNHGMENFGNKNAKNII